MNAVPAKRPPGKAKVLGIGLLALFFALPLTAAYLHFHSRVYIFDGLSGPDAPSIVAPEKPASWRQFSSGTASRLTILLTDEDSGWLGLAHGLKSLGVPFKITRSVDEAVKHRTVLVYPYVSGKVLKPDELKALAALPRSGGTLIAANVLGGGLNSLFGFRETVGSRTRFALTFSNASLAWLGLGEPEERTVRFGDPAKKADAQLGTQGYVGASEALASFDDGSAAITRRRFPDGGAAYALGFDPGFLLLLGQNARGEDLERAYVNAYAPQNDVVLRLIRQVWHESEPLAVTMGRVPDGKSLAVVMTFDVDYTRSLPNAALYAELLKEKGVRGTFLMQTKYMRDHNDEIMLNDQTVQHLDRLKSLGMELGSHTVAHARAMRKFELGTGRERYPDYQPVVLGRDEARGGTVLGELRVSKFLLETLVPGAKVVSFRPGHLANPPSLPQSMEATGYRFSSTVTAGNALSHLPYRHTYGRGTAAETNTFEFPITVEDELLPLMGLRIKPSLALARKIGRDGGLFTVLIHPNILGHKLDFARTLIDELRSEAWFGALEDFGGWWAARDDVAVDAERSSEGVVLAVAAPQPIGRLALEVPAGWRLEGASPLIRQAGRVVVIERLEGSAKIRFRLDGADRPTQPVADLKGAAEAATIPAGAEFLPALRGNVDKDVRGPAMLR